MSSSLYKLMESGQISPLAYYFARFIARGCAEGEDSVVANSAALLCTRNQRGDVCVDLMRFSGQPLFEIPEEPAAPVPLGPSLDEWQAVLSAAPWVGHPGDVKPLILDGTRLYLGRYWSYENFVAEALLSRLEKAPDLDLPLLSHGLQRLFAEEDQAHGDKINWQKVAAAIAASRRFSVISGGPGTGKTTTVVKVLALLLEQNPSLHIALAAPTGKAAARLTGAVRGGKSRVDAPQTVLDCIPEEAGTIHRLLGAGYQSNFRHNHRNPLVLDCVVIDEASMIDLPLMAQLLDALPESSRIILLGDRDQLSSVEAGNVLGDITGHGLELSYSEGQLSLLEALNILSGVTLPVDDSAPPISDSVGLLHKSYRFSDDSGIGKLARKVNHGKGQQALELVRSGETGEISWLNTHENELNPSCVDWAVNRFSQYLLEKNVDRALFLYEQFRILGALHHGPFGVQLLNQKIEHRLKAQGLIKGGAEYHGKPVMVTVNDYELNLFNGDAGLLWADEAGGLRAWFLSGADEPRSVSVRQLPQHDCAYALTVHKSQGSEFEEILLVLPDEMNRVLTRELIYTGITRARSRVTIQGGPAAFVEACARKVERSSGLGLRLGWPA